MNGLLIFFTVPFPCNWQKNKRNACNWQKITLNQFKRKINCKTIPVKWFSLFDLLITNFID